MWKSLTLTSPLTDLHLSSQTCFIVSPSQLMETPFSQLLGWKITVSFMTPLPSQSISNAKNSLCAALKIYSESDHFSTSLQLWPLLKPLYLDHWNWFSGSYPLSPIQPYPHTAARLMLLKEWYCHSSGKKVDGKRLLGYGRENQQCQECN